MRSPILLLLSCTLAITSEAQRPGASRTLDKSFDATIDSIRVAWKVPGIALAVVKGNKVIYAKGYGYRDAEQKVPVTTSTKFAIGSVSKSFTVTALGMQSAEQKFEWDTPLRRYLPDFMMYDPMATERMTPRDLVTHRSGLPRHDVTWGVGGFDRDALYQRLRYLEPTKDFRSVWQYQNLMFLTAGILSAKIDGTSWEDVVRKRIFGPLGMPSGDFAVSDLQRSPDYAFGYARTPNDSVVRIPYRVIDAIGPAGSINASIDDMAKYLTMHLNQGMFEGRQLLPAAFAREMQTPQMVIPPSPFPTAGGTDLGHEQYGMGLFVGTFRGRKLVHHGGNIDGFSAELNFLPNDSIGVVVLTNMNGTNVRDFIPFVVYDRLLGLDRIDWSGRYLQAYKQGQARAEAARSAEVSSRVANTTPSHPVADFVGTYNHPGYGDITITASNGALSFRYGILSLGLTHWHYDVFETEPRSVATPIRWKVQFLMDASGKVTGLSLPIEPALKPTVFTRQKER